MSNLLARTAATVSAALLATGLAIITAAPASSAPAAEAPAAVAPAAIAPALVPTANRSCGYGVKTKAHTCDLAFSLIRRFLDEGSPATLYDVYSPSSGNYYFVSCYAGYSTVTCRTSKNDGRTYKGRVTFAPSRIPAEYYCATDVAANDAYGWLIGNCGWVENAANAYEEGAFNEGWQWIYDPYRGRSLKTFCYGVAPTMCYSGRAYAVIRN